MIDYYEFLKGKEERHMPSGFDIKADTLHSRLFDWQKEIVKRHCRLGRSAIFADTGLGKTGMAIEWSKHVPGRVLIVAPLAVGWQFSDEAAVFNTTAPYVRSQAEVEMHRDDVKVFVTNFDRVQNFEPSQWAGVALDEASALKNHTGKFRDTMMGMWRDTPYRLAQTATPSPNDPTEILEIAQWLGIMETGIDLTRWFRRDSQKANHLTLRGHAAREYYTWLASWATALTRPSDLGNYDDTGYILPPLNIVPLLVNIDYKRFHQQGQLLPNVDVYIISTESETGIAQAIAAKEQQHRGLISNIINAQRRSGLHQDGTRLTLDDYQPTVPMALPAWLTDRRAA